MNKEIEMRIGNNIKKVRESIGMTQEELATSLQLKGCDITRSAIAKIEVGQRHLYPDEIILIKETLNTDFETIFYGNKQNFAWDGNHRIMAEKETFKDFGKFLFFVGLAQRLRACAIK